MLGMLRRFFRPARIDEDSIPEERWIADFSKPKRARFEAETGAGYGAEFKDKSLELRLEKPKLFAWAENPVYRYENVIIEASIRFSAEGPADRKHAAAGLLFRYSDTGTFYAVLVSNKGYFRVDAVFNGSPMPLIEWTETPEPIDAEKGFRLRIIALGDRLSFTIDDRWAGEVSDATLSEGRTAFAAVSYDETRTVVASLDRFRIDSRSLETEAVHYRWNAYIRIAPEYRSRLARTFLDMGQPLSALVQLKRSWKTEAQGSNAAHRSSRDLLLAAECAMRLSLYDEAEEYLDRCLEADGLSEESRRAVAEKAKLLYLSNRFAELREHAEEAIGLYPDDAMLRTLQGHAYWNLGAWEKAADAYMKAADLDPDNGIVAQNAARAFDTMKDAGRAYENYLKAARLFFRDESYEDLGLVLPRLRELRPNDPEPFALSGKRAYALEDWETATADLEAALERSERNAEDSAIPYLLALLAIRKGRREEALPLLERAVSLAGDYPVYRFRLAETRFLLNGDPHDPLLRENLEAALKLAPDDGWTANLAGQVAIARGELDTASVYVQQAAAKLPKENAVTVNGAELAFLRGDGEKALSMLGWGEEQEAAIEDETGILANEAGNIFVRQERWEKADRAYESALKRSPADPEFLRNRASCLVNLGRYGEADDTLSRLIEIDSSANTLDMIAYVAIKKGEYPRAEAAYRVGLERNPEDKALLAGLAWTYLSMARWKSAEEAIGKLERVAGTKAAAAAELRARLTEATTREVACAGCERSWRVPKDAPPALSFRLVAEPPDELPAGTCPKCGKTFCIGCGKNHLSAGRFVCPDCGEHLKLLDEGLKRILSDWASSAKNG